MLTSFVVALIGFALRYARIVVAASVLAGIACGVYSAANFALTTDISTLIAQNRPWRHRELAFEKAFPKHDQIFVVVDAPTPELVAEATTALADRLRAKPERFRSVLEPAQFFVRNGLLFQSPEELAKIMPQLAAAEPLISDMVGDLSLRGLAAGLGNAVLGVQAGQIGLDATVRPFSAAAETIENVLAGRTATFSWQSLVKGQPPESSELRRFINIRAVLDYTEIEPGRAATDTIRQVATELELASKFRASIRLTGPVPIADDEFGTLKENAFLNSAVTIAIVLGILWLALRSARIIFAVFLTLLVGLAITAAVGLALVGALNLISVCFAVLFVGLGVDFGIQFAVRYRAERHEIDDLPVALLRTGHHIGAPLTLAAAAVAAGFLSFLPTDYRGVSELGLIAGFGMVIAFLTSITVLPALLAILNPRGEPEPLGFAALAPVDAFMERNRVPIIVGTGLVVLGGLPLLLWLRFDFNPLNLRSPKIESVATYLELSRDPNIGVNGIHVLAPSLPEADAKAARLRALPKVLRAATLSAFVPSRQDEKLPLIREAASKLGDALDPKDAAAVPSDAEVVEALNDEAARLLEVAKDQSGPGAAAARRLSDAIAKLAAASPDARTRAHVAMVEPLRSSAELLRTLLSVKPLSIETLPQELVREWQTPDGRARIEVLPDASVADDAALKLFTIAVLKVEPTATGGPVSVLKSGYTIIGAFFEAGMWALGAIGVILWITLRRLGDVLLTLVPLLLAGVVTLELCALIDLPLNFANIIALPLLLGIGVAFKIYYIMAWRAGQTNLLQSSLTRAVLFSALTTATAFGSLWFSSHPGTASMGELLALSLLCTLAAAVLFQPVLMGKPRETSPP